jgi:multicomponent Na+:H+ antiporter subunit D
MSQIVIAPFLAALVTAVLTLLTRKWRRVQTTISVIGSTAYVATVVLLLTRIFPENILTYQLSNWPAPYGITFVADPLSGFMLLTSAILVLPVLLFSLTYMDEYAHQLSFQPLLHFMILGVTGAFLTGDLFNLFVWFEVMLMSSYILVGFYGGKKETKATLQYVVTNLIGSAFMLVAIGGIYANTGTLNMADLASRLAEPSAYSISMAPVLGLSALLFCVFALKSGIAPFQFWVPSAYQAAPAPVSALLAGAAKKVGIYAIIRIHLGIFSKAQISFSLPFLSGNSIPEFFGPVIILTSILSIFIGGIGAVSRESLDELLSYSSIGQVGFIMLPLGLVASGTSIGTAAIAASLMYALNHAVSKAMLFLASGSIKFATGTDRLEELGGLMDNSRVLAASFLTGALSLIGIPPLLGFFGKMMIFQSSLATVLTAVTAIAGGILTIIYFSRAWNIIFWGEEVEFTDGRCLKLQISMIAALAACIVLLGIFSNPVIEAAQHAADAAVNTDAYIQAVLESGKDIQQATGGEH